MSEPPAPAVGIDRVQLAELEWPLERLLGRLRVGWWQVPPRARRPRRRPGPSEPGAAALQVLAARWRLLSSLLWLLGCGLVAAGAAGAVLQAVVLAVGLACQAAGLARSIAARRRRPAPAPPETSPA